MMGNYPLRIPDHVMAEAKALAVQNGTSLNQFLASLITERVGEMKVLAEVEARAARANAGAASEILGRVPERKPLAGDEPSSAP